MSYNKDEHSSRKPENYSTSDEEHQDHPSTSLSDFLQALFGLRDDLTLFHWGKKTRRRIPIWVHLIIYIGNTGLVFIPLSVIFGLLVGSWSLVWLPTVILLAVRIRRLRLVNALSAGIITRAVPFLTEKMSVGKSSSLYLVHCDYLRYDAKYDQGTIITNWRWRYQDKKEILVIYNMRNNSDLYPVDFIPGIVRGIVLSAMGSVGAPTEITGE